MLFSVHIDIIRMTILSNHEILYSVNFQNNIIFYCHITAHQPTTFIYTLKSSFGPGSIVNGKSEWSVDGLYDFRYFKSPILPHLEPNW